MPQLQKKNSSKREVKISPLRILNIIKLSVYQKETRIQDRMENLIDSTNPDSNCDRDMAGSNNHQQSGFSTKLYTVWRKYRDKKQDRMENLIDSTNPDSNCDRDMAGSNNHQQSGFSTKLYTVWRKYRDNNNNNNNNNNNTTLFRHRQFRDCCPVHGCVHTLRYN